MAYSILSFGRAFKSQRINIYKNCTIFTPNYKNTATFHQLYSKPFCIKMLSFSVIVVKKLAWTGSKNCNNKLNSISTCVCNEILFRHSTTPLEGQVLTWFWLFSKMDMSRRGTAHAVPFTYENKRELYVSIFSSWHIFFSIYFCF